MFSNRSKNETESSLFRLLGSCLVGAFAGVAAFSVGNQWHIMPISVLLFSSVDMLIRIFLKNSNKEAISRVIEFRNNSIGIHVLIITFVVTSIFALEMKYDVVPDELGFLELLLPVMASFFFFGLTAGLFTYSLVVSFAYYVFVPPKFSLIFEPGPTFDSLIAFSIVSLSSMIWLSYSTRTFFDRDYQRMAFVYESINSQVRRDLTRLVEFFSKREVTHPLMLALGYAFFWAFYGFISAANGLHIDTLEAYDWGREFQLGYFKHPPFWSWVAGVWFLIFPKNDFFFYLLCETNSALGLLGAWALLGRFCSGHVRKLALACLMLTPFYQFNALRFNANTIQLSLWAWTLYFFVRSIETRKLASVLLCGLIGGIALLSKYYSLILIATCFFAALTHENRKEYFKSFAPYVTFITAFIVFSPHLVWLFKDGFQPLIYMAGRVDYPNQTIAGFYFEFIGAYILFFAIPIVLLVAARILARRSGESIPEIAIHNGPSFMTMLALGPIVLTLIAGSIGHVSLTPPDGIAVFCLFPLVLIKLINPPVEMSFRFTRKSVITVMVAMGLVAPFVPYISLTYLKKGHDDPRYEIVDEAIAIWKSETKAPLRYVAGSDPYNFVLGFRSQDNTSEFREFNFKWSPWVTRGGIQRDGMLVVCAKGDQPCILGAKNFFSEDTKVITTSSHRELWDFKGPPRQFEIIVIPPHNRRAPRGSPDKRQ